MTLPVSGAISFNNINVELGVSGTTTASLGQASYRTLAGVPSGAISMSNFYGKSNAFSFTISSNTTNANLYALAIAAGWNGTSAVTATINSGVYVSSNATGTPGLTINNSFPGGVALINNGYIIGMGGAGGRGRGTYGGTEGTPGSAGGLALSVSVAVSITNNGTIGGGGGGGGGGGAGWKMIDTYYSQDAGYGGGGGGGGRTGATNSSAGAGGTPSGQYYKYNGNAGSAGTSASGGGGGSGAAPNGGAGGSGGTWGSAGATGGTGSGTGTAGVNRTAGFGGGSAGAAVSGNANITWVATGTRLGAIT